MLLLPVFLPLTAEYNRHKPAEHPGSSAGQCSLTAGTVFFLFFIFHLSI